MEEISVVRVQAMKDKAMFAEMLVQQKPIKFQVDCEASANILPNKHVGGVDLAPCSQSLVMWNGTRVKPMGACALQVVNPQNNTKYQYKVRFLVVRENLTPLLGLNATEKMGLLTVHKENFVDLVVKYTDVFDNGLGKLPGKVHLQVDPACQPVIPPARKVPISVRENFKCVSREMFQKHLHQELLGLLGVKCIADDVLIYGTDVADHDSNLEFH